MSRKKWRWHAVAKRVKPGATGAEVGVYKGTMSRNLFKLIRGLKLFMIDRWQPYTEAEQTASPKTRIAKIKSKRRWRSIKMKAKAVAKRYRKGARIIKADSVEAAIKIKDKSLDFVFIDGDHSYQGVKRDIAAWLPKIKAGGWLMGHDYGLKPDGGVRKAVDELGMEVERDYDHVWAIKKVKEKKEQPAIEEEVKEEVEKKETDEKTETEAVPSDQPGDQE